MSERAIEKMGADEFLERHLAQEQRYELVDGVPVAIAGAKRRHDQVVVNAIGLLAGSLGTARRRASTSDTAEVVEDLDAAATLPDVGLRVPLAALHAGLDFQQRFRLVRRE